MTDSIFNYYLCFANNKRREPNVDEFDYVEKWKDTHIEDNDVITVYFGKSKGVAYGEGWDKDTWISNAKAPSLSEDVIGFDIKFDQRFFGGHTSILINDYVHYNKSAYDHKNPSSVHDINESKKMWFKMQTWHGMAQAHRDVTTKNEIKVVVNGQAKLGNFIKKMAKYGCVVRKIGGKEWKPISEQAVAEVLK